jgi:serine/threonine protein phosphatase PrpC
MSGNHRLHWESTGISHPGKVRNVNEDSFLDRGEHGLWLVADGMGGHSAGDVASQAIAEEFRALDLPQSLSGSIDAAETALLTTNRRLRELSAERTDQATIGSTVAALLMRGRFAVALWVGDSRVYRLRDGELKQLTQDHSQVEELIGQGLLLREDAEQHPAANVVTRAVGAIDEVYVDLDYTDVAAGDYFLLCSDGLTKELSTADIRATLGVGTTTEEIGAALIDLALQRGARDNVTVVVVRVLE